MKISPSILSCNFANLERDIKKVSDKVEYLHIDVMDGVFVPNISFGIPVIQAIRPLFKNVFDVHLMIIDPIKYVPVFAACGSDIITFHIESDSDPRRTINLIHELGCKAGLSIKPGTSVDTIREFLPLLDLVLVMSVEPGFGGQSFMLSSIPKIQELARLKKQFNYTYEIEVDGGINDETSKLVAKAGVEVIVAGSYIFKNKDIDLAIETLK